MSAGLDEGAARPKAQEDLIDETYPLYLECRRQIGPQWRTLVQWEAPTDDRTREFVADVEREGRTLYRAAYLAAAGDGSALRSFVASERHQSSGGLGVRTDAVAPALARGAIAALVAVIPAVALTTAIFRFPVPLAESYARGPADVPIAVKGAIFYLSLGGSLVLGALGAAGGLLAHRIGSPDRPRVRRLTIAFAAAVALGSALFLSILENLIGPW